MERSRLRTAFVAFVVAVAGWHVVAVTAASLPPNRYSDAVEPGTDYLAPFFTQNWRLFAPNPIGEDRSMRFQASYRDEAGDVVRTEWIDWTSVELDVVHHRVVGGRAGYVTSKLIETLSSINRRLGAGREASLAATDDDPPTWDELTDDLEEAGTAPSTAVTFVRHEKSVAELATGVVLARHPDLDLVAVRYGVAIQPVVPFSRRNTDDPRPDVQLRLSGWRTSVPGSAAARAAIADFDARHR